MMKPIYAHRTRRVTWLRIRTQVALRQADRDARTPRTTTRRAEPAHGGKGHQC